LEQYQNAAVIVRFIPKSKWIRGTLLVSLAIAGLIAAWLWRSALHVPEFYASRLVVEEAGPMEESLQEQLQDLQTALTQDGPWRIAFTEAEINAWLAGDVRKQFPRAVPPYVTDPRIQLSDGFAQVACQYTHDELVAVVSAKVHLEPIDRPNSIVMKVFEPRIGSVPGPGDLALRQLRMVAARAGLRVVWRNEANPIGEITLPPKVTNTPNQIMIDEVVLEEGRMVIAGVTTVVPPVVPKVVPKVVPPVVPPKTAVVPAGK